MVRVRLAPSPTGSPHIGTAWGALFDFVFAKKNNGKFILRLEDTDRARYVAESEQEIIESLKWLGFDYDEVYKQSDRLDIYKKYSDELLEKGLAYKDEGAIRFKTPKMGKTYWHDLIGDEQSSRGGKKISFDNGTQDDFVILKSDGFPTYNFANVVDDHLMEITHVIRGDEFISSTPKHLMLYQAFNWTPPQFAHLPVLVGADRSKLSKRHGAKGALEFKKEGFLKEALINFLALLGWSHPEGKEIFSLEEMIEVFDFKQFNSSSAYFDVTKLEWLNGEYIRKMSNEELEKRLDKYLVDHPAKGKLVPIIPLIKERIKKLSDFIPLTYFFFTKVEYEKQVFQKLTAGHPAREAVLSLRSEGSNLENSMSRILEIMQKMQKPWKADIFEQAFKKLAEELDLSASQMFQLIRVAISGQSVTPPLFDSIKILGEKETVKRVSEALAFVKSAP